MAPSIGWSERSWTGGRRWACVLAAATLLGCGARQPDDDSHCDRGERAYTNEPLLRKCSQIRTSEGRVDPATGKQERFHRFFYCCR
ncbi:MAG: hypothetical protein IT376_11775 [Polyangiaceae bacterium]|nr:hypothetical protein [Polyangiaceae bacterium]